MVSPTEAGFDLREMKPLPGPCPMDRQRSPDPVSKGLAPLGSACDTQGQALADAPVSPAKDRDSAERGWGRPGNRRLNHSIESICVNMGGASWDAKARSRLMPTRRVGVARVLGAWESQAQGEGRQESDAPGPQVPAHRPGERTQSIRKEQAGNGDGKTDQG